MLSFNYRIESTYEYVEYKKIRAKKKASRFANRDEKSEKNRKDWRKRKNPFLFSAHLDFGVSFTENFQLFNKPEVLAEHLLTTPTIGFPLSTNKGQRLFFETGIFYAQPGIKNRTEFNNEPNHYIYTTKETWHQIRVPFSVGINASKFQFNFGFSIANAVYDRFAETTYQSYSGGASIQEYKNKNVTILEPATANQYGPFIKVGYALSDCLTLHTNTQYNLQEVNQNWQVSLGVAYAFKK